MTLVRFAASFRSSDLGTFWPAWSTVLELTQDPEFNSELVPPAEPGVFGTVLGWVFGGGSDEEFEIQPTAPEEVRERAIDRLIRKTAVLPVHFSFVFRISITTEDAEKSAKIANTIAEEYILRQIEVKYTATEQAAGWLSNRVSELKVDLERAEEAVAEHRAQNELISEEAVEQLAARLVSLKSTRQEVRTSRSAAAEQLSALRELTGRGDFTAIAELTGSIRLENLATVIAENGGPEAPRAARAVERFSLELRQVMTRARPGDHSIRYQPCETRDIDRRSGDAPNSTG